MEMLAHCQRIVSERWDGITDEKQRAVLYIICEYSKDGKWISQDEISRAERLLGCHGLHEAHLENKKASTLRMIRQLIRDLRVDHGIPIISSRNGYKLPATEGEAAGYLEDLEREAKAQAASWFETYRAMSDSLKIQSNFFETQRPLYESAIV